MSIRADVEVAGSTTKELPGSGGSVVDSTKRIPTLREAKHTFEHRYITEVFELCKRDVRTAARVLGMNRPNLYRRMRQLGIRLK